MSLFSSSLTTRTAQIDGVKFHITFIIATLYVLSGVTQPLLMTIAKGQGIADPTCQLYMLFYYIGPTTIIFILHYYNEEPNSWYTIIITSCSACIDIIAQTMNYTGSIMAGPTIFAIIYSSVTVWCAIFSRILLKRYMNITQWFAVTLVMGGLCIAGLDSSTLGTKVFHGALLVIVGSALHATMYVLSEFVMNPTSGSGETVSARKFCVIYNSTALFGYIWWQILYTRNHFDEKIIIPSQQQQTTLLDALITLLCISIASLIHSITFFHTVKYFPGGATTAGVMKALQAVLVFVVTSIVFCNPSMKYGGIEMCFTFNKFISLFIVVIGLLIYGKATTTQQQQQQYQIISNTSTTNNDDNDKNHNLYIEENNTTTTNNPNNNNNKYKTKNIPLTSFGE